MLLVACALTGALAADASAQRGDRDRYDRDRDRSYDNRGPERWEQLGCVELGRRDQGGTINVGRREGTFKAIRLEVFRNSLELEGLRIIFGNGEVQSVRGRARVSAGDRSRIIDLEGRQRFIDRIELDGRKVGPRSDGNRGPARVCAHGLHGDGPPAPPPVAQGGPIPPPPVPGRPGGYQSGYRYEVLLGCQKVGLNIDRDTIQVADYRRYRAVNFKVSGNSVNVMDVKVLYRSGEVDDLPVRSKIAEGGESGPVDLRGRERAIDRIEMVYRTDLNFRGSANVCAYGID
jgi:hypothetical protein